MKNISFRRKIKDRSIKLKELEVIRGFKISRDMKAAELLEHYKSIGFQASNIGKASEIISKTPSFAISVFFIRSIRRVLNS